MGSLLGTTTLTTATTRNLKSGGDQQLTTRPVSCRCCTSRAGGAQTSLTQTCGQPTKPEGLGFLPVSSDAAEGFYRLVNVGYERHTWAQVMTEVRRVISSQRH
jgi:hypothetical protein